MNPRYLAALRYQAAWLDIPIERLQGDGFVNPTPKRGESIAGYSQPVRAHALQLEGRQEIYAACVPGLEQKLRLKKMSHHQFFWFDSLNPAIDISRAKLLIEGDLPKFMRFFQEAYPKSHDTGWVPDYFCELVEKKRCFGIFEEEVLVSVADSPTVPYLQELVVEPGIMTLPKHRMKGYAAAVCAAFIQEQLRQGFVPVWTCAADNAGSAGLARHLGFQPFGVLWRMT